MFNAMVLQFLLTISMLLMFSCGNNKEIAREDAVNLQNEYAARIFEKTVRKPGPPEYALGSFGGETHSTISTDIRSFNMIVVHDGTTASVLDNFFPYLFSYDAYKKKYEPGLAEHFEIEYDRENNINYVNVRLKDNIYWATIKERKTKLSSDDIIYWYDEIEGDERLQMSAYIGQFVTLEDGSQDRIRIEKIDDLNFRFVIPRIFADPLFMVNMNFAPKYIYENAKKEGGVQGLLDVLSIDTDPSEVPSIGPYMLAEYVPSQRIVLKRNPDYWEYDDKNNQLPYIETRKITIASEDTSLLMLKNNEITSRSLSNTELDEIISVESPHFTVYNRGTSLGSKFYSFNQNTSVVDEHKLRWFTSKKFRQAMSAALPRQRIIDEVHRGLGEPALHFFSKANKFYDPSITLKYTHDLDTAKSLLKEDGFYLKDDILYDSEDIPVEFEISINAENKNDVDTTSIYTQELKKLGIKVNIRPVDFPNLVERLTTSYDWDAIIVALGSNSRPESGTNVWPSSGKLHLWYPLQESPATSWEARIDELFELGKFTLDFDERKKLYDEYQEILLEELPLIYIANINSFVTIDTSIQNIFIDNLSGSDAIYHYFAK